MGNQMDKQRMIKMNWFELNASLAYNNIEKTSPVHRMPKLRFIWSFFSLVLFIFYYILDLLLFQQLIGMHWHACHTPVLVTVWFYFNKTYKKGITLLVNKKMGPWMMELEHGAFNWFSLNFKSSLNILGICYLTSFKLVSSWLKWYIQC